MDSLLSRRRFLTVAGTLAGASALNTSLPAMAHAARMTGFPRIGPSDAERFQLPSGMQFGDVREGRAIIWGRSDRNARMTVEVDTTERFRHGRRSVGPWATAETDYTTRIDLAGLLPGRNGFCPRCVCRPA